MRVTAVSFLFFLSILFCSAQTILFEEDFNTCTYNTPSWNVVLNGNPDFVWYIGTPLNPGSDSTSIDGSCMLIMDDDATGENTPAVVAEFQTPVFDGSGYARLFFEADISYRDFNEIDEKLEVILFDGQNEFEIAHFEGNMQTGEQFSDFVHLKIDLSLFAQSENMQVLIRYDDGNGGWGWYCGVDNIRITGEGQGTPVLIETFNSCTLPNGWTTQILSGQDDWVFTNPPSAQYDSSASMNGSCFALFDDDYLGDSADVSVVRLISPWFDGRDYASFQLDFDFILRYWAESFTVYVEHGDGSIAAIETWNDDVGGPEFNNYVHQSIDISGFRNPEMRVVFEYNDGNTWSWWAGIDNVKIVGDGVAYDVCSRALPLQSNQNCLYGDNKTAIFEGSIPSCSEINSSGVWYRWTADFTGEAMLELNSDFNDVVSVFAGDCSNLTWVHCANRDRYGFEGEKSYFQAQAGTAYYLRISGGQDERFGKLRGEFCIKISQKSAPAAPSNNPCLTAIPLTLGTSCTQGNNKNANATFPLPKRNLRIAADVWYQFTAPNLSTNERLRITSDAQFSDVLTVYGGTCQNLTEVVSTEFGQELDLENLSAGAIYYLQIGGNFAMIEGDFCVKTKVVQKEVAPLNTDCQAATPLLIGDTCRSGSLQNANFSGIHPPCILQTNKDVWYSFIAPANEAVYLWIPALFSKNITLWEGTCTNLEPFKCLRNPTTCDGYQKITGLSADKSYYIQVSATGKETGNFCIQLLPSDSPPPFEPLQLNVQTQCIGIDSAVLLVQANQGTTPYEWPGNIHQQLLYSGEPYNVVVRDAQGCEKAISGIAPDCDGAVLCGLTSQLSSANSPSCADASDGNISITTNDGQAPFTYLWNTSGVYGATASDLSAGVYSVTVYDANGCSATVSQTLSAPPVLEIEIASIQNPTNGQTNGRIETILSGGTGVLTATWYDDSGQLLSNSTILDQIGTGTYTLEITDENGCIASETIVLQLSATHSKNTASYVQLSPNPAVKSTRILSDSFLGKKCAVHIQDATGKRVLSKSDIVVEEGGTLLSLESVPPGTYFVRLHFGKKTFTERLVVVP